MRIRRSHLTAVLALALACGVTACSAEKKPASTDATHDMGDMKKAGEGAAGDMEKAAEGAAGDMEKAAGDAMAKIEQTHCPVSGEPLDGMDPVTVTSGSRTIKLCCKDCVADFEKDPAKYIAIVDAAAKK